MSNNFRDSQQELIKSILNGDTSNFVKLVEPYYEKLFLKALSIVKYPDDAKDVLQDSFLAAYLSIKKFKNESNIYTWLYKIVVNKSIDYYKKRNKKKIESWNPYSNNKESDIYNISYNNSIKNEQNELFDYLISAINKLDEKYKEILIMRYFDNLSYEEISEIKKIRIGTVKSRLFKAKELLRKILLHEKKEIIKYINTMDLFILFFYLIRVWYDSR